MLEPTRTDDSRWRRTLDELEAALDGYVALSVAAYNPDDETPPLPVFTPSGDLGPLPEGLRVRAVELACRARLIEVELGRVRDETAAQLASLNARPNNVYDSAASASRLLDTHT